MTIPQTNKTLFGDRVAAAEAAIRKKESPCTPALTAAVGAAIGVMLGVTIGAVIYLLPSIGTPPRITDTLGPFGLVGLATGVFFGGVHGASFARSRAQDRLSDIEVVAPDAVEQARENIADQEKQDRQTLERRAEQARQKRLRRAGIGS